MTSPGAPERRTLTPADIEHARRRLDGIALRTPVVRCDRLDRHLGLEVVFKAEPLQLTGSFKFRGAVNAIAARKERCGGDLAGVVTHSSGNHGQALAFAARLAGCPATVVMPSDAPRLKVAATERHGATIVRYDRYTERREDISAAIAAEHGLALIPPFDDLDVMAGQGTLGLELAEQMDGRIDALVVCLGGGGLLSGCGVALAEAVPDARLVGVEPRAGDDWVRSLSAGQPVEIAVPRTIADGQATTRPGDLPFATIADRLDSVALVSDDEIVDAMAVIHDQLKIVVEPSGASALAALLAGRIDLCSGARVGVTLSGGNVGAERFAELISGRSRGADEVRPPL